MGTAAYGAQDTLDSEKDLCPVCLDMAVVRAITDEGAQAAAGAGKAGGLHQLHEIVIRFLGNRVAFTDRYGYHNLAGGLNP